MRRAITLWGCLVGGCLLASSGCATDEVEEATSKAIEPTVVFELEPPDVDTDWPIVGEDTDE